MGIALRTEINTACHTVPQASTFRGPYTETTDQAPG